MAMSAVSVMDGDSGDEEYDKVCASTGLLYSYQHYCHRQCTMTTMDYDDSGGDETNARL